MTLAPRFAPAKARLKSQHPQTLPANARLRPAAMGRGAFNQAPNVARYRAAEGKPKALATSPGAVQPPSAQTWPLSPCAASAHSMIAESCG